MADRPGDPDARIVAAALKYRSDLHAHEADAAFDRIEARLSEAEAKIAWDAEHRSEVVQLERERREEVERRLSVYEQARDVLHEWRHGSDWMGEGSGQMPDRVALLRVEEILARAALTTETETTE